MYQWLTFSLCWPFENKCLLKKKIKLCLWNTNWVSSLVFSSKGFCRSSCGYHDHAQFYNILVSAFFSWETWRRLLVYCWSEVGNKFFPLLTNGFILHTQSLQNRYTFFSLNNYTWLQAFLDFVFLLNKTVSGSLPLWYLVTLKWALRSWLESKLLCIVCSY